MRIDYQLIKKKMTIELYVTIYKKVFWEFNVLPHCVIEREGTWWQINIKFLIFALEIHVYDKRIRIKEDEDECI